MECGTRRVERGCGLIVRKPFCRNRTSLFRTDGDDGFWRVSGPRLMLAPTIEMTPARSA